MSGVTSVGAKALGAVTNFKPLQKACNYFENDPAKALAYSTIASLLIKDGIGCYMYVNQSLHNKKIPEDKRKFVAALDLTNGVLMILTQLVSFFAMRKFNQTFFPKLFKKSFDKNGNVLKTITSQIRLNQKKAAETVDRKLTIKKEYDKIKKTCYDCFSFVTELAAATIFAKRVVVPFLATPLAEKVKNKMNKNGAETLSQQSDVNPALTERKPQVTEGQTNLLDKYKK